MTPVEPAAILVAVMMLSDLTIACAYYAIPVALWVLLRQHRGLPFRWLFVMFAVFIAACGTTHLMRVVQAFTALPLLAKLVEMVTAVVSSLTALLLWVFLDRLAEALEHPLAMLRTGGGHGTEQPR